MNQQIPTTRSSQMVAEGDTQADSSRQRLIEAGTSVFAEYGYDKARVQEIARRAGLTTGAIYARFRSKAELFFEIVGMLITSELADSWQNTDQKLSQEEAFALSQVHLLGHLSESTRAILTEGIVAAQRDPEAAELLKSRLAGRAQQLVALFHADKGERSSSVDSVALNWFFQSLIVGSLLLDALNVPRPDVEPWQELMRRVSNALENTDASTHQNDRSHR